VLKADVSALAIADECRIFGVWWITKGMAVDIFWDATADVLAFTLPTDTSGYLDFSSFGGLRNNAGAGKTGDILFTTVGHSTGDTYLIILDLRKP
jgi:hypothetical protein